MCSSTSIDFNQLGKFAGMVVRTHPKVLFVKEHSFEWMLHCGEDKKAKYPRFTDDCPLVLGQAEVGLFFLSSANDCALLSAMNLQTGQWLVRDKPMESGIDWEFSCGSYSSGRQDVLYAGCNG